MNIFKSTLVYNNLHSRFSFPKRKVYLTFDDGHKYADEILEKLEKYNQKATFFLCGSYMSETPSVYKKIFNSGHEIGNHSYNHPNMIILSSSEIVEELSRTQQLIREITENNVSMLFRFPYGASNKSLVHFIKQQGYTPINWTIDSKDWTGISALEIYNNVINSKHLKNGAIILMHTSGSHTAEALDLIIPALKEQNYEMLTIPKLL